MNHLVTTNAYDSSLTEASDISSRNPEDLAERRAKNLFISLRTRWYYYLFITVVAAVAGYYVANEYGSYEYIANAQIRVTKLPFPPGGNYLETPKLNDFNVYLTHPEVMASMRDRYGVNTVPGGPPLVKDELNRKTETLTISTKRPTPEEAADLINGLTTEAIAKSTEERVEYLNRSLVFYNRLVSEAEADAALKRQAKIDRIEAMRATLSVDPQAEFEIEEINRVISGQRIRLEELELELKDAVRLSGLLQANQKELIGQTIREITEQYKSDLEAEAESFAPGSNQAKFIAQRSKSLDRIATSDLKTLDDLSAAIRDIGQLLNTDPVIPDNLSSRIDRIRDQLNQLAIQSHLLPQAIEDAEQALQDSLDKRAGMEITKLLDMESSPEIAELTAQIERADHKVDQLTSAIDWVKGMLALDQPAFEVLTSATAKTAVPDGNHLKLAVAAFGLVGLLLGLPVLVRDIFHTDNRPSGRLAKEFGLPAMSAQEIRGRNFKTPALQSHDPELRLLANRIQQSARDARGSVVLFSSLSDSVSTNELTRTIAGCLAAREEKVLVIELDTLDRNRALSEEGPHRSGKPNGVLDDQLQQSGPVGHKVGLAMALAGATTEIDDVLICHDESGIDRLQLGSGELPVEAFASPLMSRLLDRCRNQYSLILLSGPSAKHLADLQVLSAKSDGTLFVAPSRGQISASARRTIMDLVSHQVPVMGIVEIPA